MKPTHRTVTALLLKVCPHVITHAITEALHALDVPAWQLVIAKVALAILAAIIRRWIEPPS